VGDKIGRRGNEHSKRKNENDASNEAWARFERAVDAAVKSGPKHKAPVNEPAKKMRPAKSRKEEKPE
jgi:hypothetical protein